MKASAHRLLLPSLFLVGLVAGCGAPQEQDLLDDARVSYASGDESRAMIQLKNLLRASPNNKEARLLRGEVSLSLEDGATAEQDFLRAEELGVERAEIVVNLGKAMMLQGAFERVIAEIHGGAASDKQTGIDVLLLRGDAYLALQKFGSAKRAFGEVLGLAPNSPDARVGLGRVALAEDHIGDALTELARAVSAGPELPRVWIANGEVQLAIGNSAEAKESFQRALKLRPVAKLKRDDFAALNGLFQSHLALDEIDQALAVAEQAQERSHGHPLAHYLLGQHAMHTGDNETAIEHLLSTLTYYPRHLGALSSMGSIRLDQGELEEAGIYLRQALEMDRHNPRIRMQLAQTMLRLNEGHDALELLAPVMRKLGDVPELLALAGHATAVARGTSDWLRYFEQAAAADPSNLKWQFELAQAYIAAGQADRSIGILNRIPDSAEFSDRRDLIMIEAHRRAGELDAALDLANQLLERTPDDAGRRLMLGQLHLATGDLAAAREQLDAVLEADRDNIHALLTLGQVELKSSNLDVAEGLFRDAYNKQPDYLPTVTLLVSLAQSRGRYDEAIDWLKAARLTRPVSIMPRIGLVSMYLMQDKVSLAYELAQEAMAIAPTDPRSLTALGMTQIRREEFRLAVHTLEKAAAVAPRSGMIRFQLSRAYHGLKHFSDARRALRKAVELAPWRANYAVAAAKLDLSLNNAAGAATMASELVRSHPANPVGYSLLGKAFVLQGKYAEATEVLDRAVELGGKATYVMQHYDALVQAGVPSPHRVLIEWVEEHPRDWRVRVLLAQAHHSGGETTQAIEQYERVLKDSPDNTAVLNNLAWLYSDTDAERALELAETVHRLDPHVGTFTDTLGWMLVMQGEFDRGLSLIRKATQQAPDDEEISYHLAAALAQVGEIEEARLLLTQLISSGKPFDSKTEARTLLKKL